jgi:vacuolar protein sorting-associated protein 13D
MRQRKKYTFQVQGDSCLRLIKNNFFSAGEVELENLPLKKDALSHFGLPIKAYSGSIGKIKLQIPVRQFRTAPWCISIEKVYVICGPVNLDEVNYGN